MTVFGVDVHPQFQAGLNIEQVAREGFGFLSTKLVEGTSAVYEDMGSAGWIRRAKSAGMTALGYAYLQPGDIPQQARVFAASLDRCDVAGVIDAETLAADGRTPTLTPGMIREFHTRLTTAGARIPLLYLPRWYWQRIGSPDLTGLPALWASSYPSGTQLPASVLYQNVTPDRWASYGNLPVEVLQFAETGLVAGHAIDVNAYRGTPTQFAALTGAPVLYSASTRKEPTMPYRLDPTPILTGATPDAVPDGTWPAVEDTITSPGPAGGWPGRVMQHLTFGFGGGFIQEAWAAPSGHHFVTRYDPVTKTGGQFVDRFVTQHWELPLGDIALIVRYATRARGSVTPEVEH